MTSISEEPIKIAKDTEGLQQRVHVYINEFRTRVGDGLTLSELCEITLGGMRLAIAFADELDVGHEEKKNIVSKLAVSLFDEFGYLVLPLPLKPLWWIIKPTLRSLVMALAGGAVETLLPLVRTVDE